jgi:hypothetical protein
VSSNESTLFAAGADRAFERELLAAGRAAPLESEHTEAAWARFAAGLGTVASAAAVSQLPSAVTAGQVVSGVTAPARWLERFAAAKWLLIGGLVGSALTMAWMEQRSNAEALPSARTQSAPTVAAAPAAPSEMGPAPSSATVAPATPPSVGVVPSNVKRAAAATVSSSASLAAEVSALDAARTAIGIGAWRDAHSLLRRYHAQFPKGALSVDAEVLAIEALAGEGRTADAQRAAERFLTRRPNDPQASRVRWLARTPDAP